MRALGCLDWSNAGTGAIVISPAVWSLSCEGDGASVPRARGALVIRLSAAACHCGLGLVEVDLWVWYHSGWRQAIYRFSGDSCAAPPVFLTARQGKFRDGAAQGWSEIGRLPSLAFLRRATFGNFGATTS